MKLSIAMATVLLLAAPAVYAADNFRYGLSVDVVHDDNATRGLYDGVKSDSILSLEGSATRSVLLGAHSGVLLRAAARYSHFTDIKDISNVALVGRAAWRTQPSLGFGAPWYEIAGQAQLLRHADSELRDGNIVSIEASLGAYVTDRTRASGGAGFDKRSGGGTAGLYDLSSNRIWGTLDVRLGLRNTVYVRLTRQAGDQVFSSGSVRGLSAVWEDDPALRAPLGLAVANTYQLDATTFIYELGYNHPLGRSGALDLSAAHASAKVNEGLAEGNKYRVTQVRASYLFRFR